jgi:hypothetical protein
MARQQVKELHRLYGMITLVEGCIMFTHARNVMALAGIETSHRVSLNRYDNESLFAYANDNICQHFHAAGCRVTTHNPSEFK